MKQAFWKIAATLCGVPAMKPNYEISSYIVPATIVNHEQHDPAVAGGKVPQYTKDVMKCIIC